MTHSKFSPSSATRWFLCPGSVSASEDIFQVPSPFAEEGTLAHKLAETCLKMSLSAEECAEFERDTYPEEMVHYVQMFLDLVDRYREDKDLLYVEKLVTYDRIAPGGYGTCDALLISEGQDEVHIFDLKYGKGIHVSAENNIQLMMYALGVRQSVPGCKYVTRYHLHIVQPRIHNFSSVTVLAGDLDAFGSTVTEKAREVLQNPNKRIPGPVQCKWCPAKEMCPEYEEHVRNEITEAFRGATALSGGKVVQNIDEKKRLLDMEAEILAYLKQLKKDLVQEILSGGTCEGYKVVESRKNRKWKDESIPVLEELLGEAAYCKKIISVPEAEKLLGPEKIRDLAGKEKGGPCLVPESDPRRPYEETTILDLFKQAGP